MVATIDSSGKPTTSDIVGGIAGAGAGVLAGILGGGDKSLPFQPELMGISGSLQGVGQAAQGQGQVLFQEGQPLINALSSGQLPPGADAVVQQMIQQQTAATKARYASIGQTGSTMEQDALNQIQNAATAQKFQIAQQMQQAGEQMTRDSLSSLGITAQAFGAQAGIFENLMKTQMKQDSDMNTTIGAFAGALGKALPALVKAA